MIQFKTIDRISSLITIIGFAVSATKFMMKTFKKYEKKHGKKDNNDV